MKAFWTLTRLRILDVLRSRSSTAFVVLFPVLLVLIVGGIFSRGHPFEKRRVIVLAAPTSEIARRITTALVEEQGVRLELDTQPERALGKLSAREASAVIEVKQGVEIWVGPEERLFGVGLVQALPLAATLTVRPRSSLGYVHYLLPGILAFSVMLSGLFATGYTMVLYRQNGFLKKLASTPISKLTFLAAQVSARALLVLVQVALMLGVALLVFGLPASPGVLCMLMGINGLGLLAFMGAGFALACVIKNPDLVVDIISAVTFPVVLLSEIFFPLDVLPTPLRVVGGILPSTEMIRLSREVLLYGTRDAAHLSSGILILVGWAVAAFVAGGLAFKWHE